ncbi:hypothetical protein K490DRAFT_68239 [Saccharata proteae CBS 121410]|uniref:PHD-type domain-containing protein n=1 Tax=Saccharata proteae CBS 121410 TaxID=1314787 RepID=A0A9P4HS81_9PEZI|nr:hypothetical protein K490DRAFT_68239 [Saccharata proteae CBS 121410]
MSSDRQSTALPATNGSSAAAAPPSSASTTAANNQSNAPAKPKSSSLAPSAASPAPMSAPQFPGFSASTEEILRRVSANASASAHAGTPGWEAAREQVLKSMVTSDKIATPPPIISGSSRKGRGNLKVAPPRLEGAADSSATPVSAASPAANRGKGSGRGRGKSGKAAKGAKRKRDADSPDSEDDSDISSSYTPLPTKTKSGRSVNKPTQFVPVLPSPTSATKKKKPLRRPTETSVCKVCLRGHSPAMNMIVFCDSCNTGFHQYCHDPPIEREVIQIAAKEWHCSRCRAPRAKQLDDAVPKVTELVAGEDLSIEEKRAYFMTLSTAKLTELLLHATSILPSLPVFAPNSRNLIPTNSTSNDAVRASNPPQQVAGQSSTTNGNIGPAASTDSMDITTSSTTQPQQIPQAPATDQSQTPRQPSAPGEPSMIPVAEEQDPDPYDGYDSDPPAHYPKPGNGLARTLRPESDDLQWLVDDNLEVFSHVYNNEGLNGFGMDTAMDAAETGATAGP